MTSRRRRRINLLGCPSCFEIGVLRKILNGMPGDDFDYEKYSVGGCIGGGFFDPDIACRGCGWTGFREAFGYELVVQDWLDPRG